MFIGFDYGTSNCAVAVMEQGSPRLLTLSGSHYLPSTLHAPHRDAIAGLLAEGLAPVQQSEYLKLRGPVVTRAQAVSYTHLDVYKRQTAHALSLTEVIGLVDVYYARNGQAALGVHPLHAPQTGPRHGGCLLYTSRCV